MIALRLFGFATSIFPFSGTKDKTIPKTRMLPRFSPV
jgi:hypothetical protein